MNTGTENISIQTTIKPMTGQESYNASKYQMSQIINGQADGNGTKAYSILTGMGSNLDIKI